MPQTTGSESQGGPASPSVAIIGARGIGKHHANWWKLAGVRVCAIAGTSPETLQAAAANLKALFGFDGGTYTDVRQMLEQERPRFVDVCSPPPLHAIHVRMALAAGSHVLCEKPLCHDPAKTAVELLAEADGLVREAAARKLILSLCSQYIIAAETCLRLFRQAHPHEAVREVAGRLASPGRGRTTDPEFIWADLGSHLLAAVQALGPQGVLDPESLRTEFSPDHARCQFRLAGTSSSFVCRLHVFRTEGEPSHVRELALNDMKFQIDGERLPDGSYGARIVSPLGVHREDDPMRQLIRRMSEGRPPLAGAEAYRNLEWLLRVAEAAGRNALSASERKS